MEHSIIYIFNEKQNVNLKNKYQILDERRAKTLLIINQNETINKQQQCFVMRNNNLQEIDLSSIYFYFHR
jgi:hypothetical protein